MPALKIKDGIGAVRVVRDKTGKSEVLFSTFFTATLETTNDDTEPI